MRTKLAIDVELDTRPGRSGLAVHLPDAAREAGVLRLSPAEALALTEDLRLGLATLARICPTGGTA